MSVATEPPAPARSDVRPIVMILLAMLSFAIQDVAVKIVAEHASIWQMQAIRSVAVLVLLTVVATLIGQRRDLLPTRWRWPLARSILMTGAYLFFYASLPFLTLAQAAAAFFVGPLLITIFAALLLGEPIGPRRVIAVVVGFVGVLAIVDPRAEDWSPVALMPILAALCYALAAVMTRWRCRDQPGFALTVVHNLVYAGLGLVGIALIPLAPVSDAARATWPFLLEGWTPLVWGALLLLMATAFTHVVGMLATVVAYRDAEASRIAPFEYAYLAITPIFDFAIWGVLPTSGTVIGMALIIASGAFVAWREGRPARPRVQFRAEVPWTPDGAAPPEQATAGSREQAATASPDDESASRDDQAASRRDDGPRRDTPGAIPEIEDAAGPRGDATRDGADATRD